MTRELGVVRRRTKVRVVTQSVLVIGVIGVLTYLVVDTWMTNARVKAELETPVIVDDADPVSRQEAEGRDEEEIKPSAVDAYRTAADLPRTMTIEKLNVHARVLPMGVNADSSMQAPLNIFDSGWYTGSAKPGEAGAMLIDGHASGPSRQGLFAYVDTLVSGDMITVERGDGEVLRYEVKHVETTQLEQVDMDKALQPYDDATEGLNLITCAGTWLQDEGTFTDRAIVYAVRVT